MDLMGLGVLLMGIASVLHVLAIVIMLFAGAIAVPRAESAPISPVYHDTVLAAVPPIRVLVAPSPRQQISIPAVVFGTAAERAAFRPMVFP